LLRYEVIERLHVALRHSQNIVGRGTPIVDGAVASAKIIGRVSRTRAARPRDRADKNAEIVCCNRQTVPHRSP